MAPESIPILPSMSFDDTSSFYGRLGFEEAARWSGDYLIMKHPIGIEIHFFGKENLERDDNDAGCYIRFGTASEAQALHDAWQRSGLGWEHLRTPEETDYGLLEFAVLDIHRNLLRIGGPIEKDS